MPRALKKTQTSAVTASGNGEQQRRPRDKFDFEGTMSPPSHQSSPAAPRDETPIVPRVAKKRPAEGAAIGTDFSSEMQKMLECFGVDITKTLVTKQKRLEQFTQTSLKSSNKKIDEIWKQQQNERNKLNEEYYKQVGAVLQQWEVDLDRSREQEEKLVSLFKQQQKLFQQAKAVQSQRLKSVRQLHEQFTKGLEDLEKCHLDQQSNVQSELRKEMALLQKRILMDTQQQEMANVRKSLQTMLF